MNNMNFCDSASTVGSRIQIGPETDVLHMHLRAWFAIKTATGPMFVVQTWGSNARQSNKYRKPQIVPAIQEQGTTQQN